MPRDKNGVWHEPTNEDRIRWATVALEAYSQATNGRPWEDYDGEDSKETVVKDLLTDLMHFVGDSEVFFEWQESSYASYREEVELAELEASP